MAEKYYQIWPRIFGLFLCLLVVCFRIAFSVHSSTSVLCAPFSQYFHPAQHNSVVHCEYELQQCSLWYRCLLINQHSCRTKSVSKKCWEIVLTHSVSLEHAGVVLWVVCVSAEPAAVLVELTTGFEFCILSKQNNVKRWRKEIKFYQ